MQDVLRPLLDRSSAPKPHGMNDASHRLCCAPMMDRAEKLEFARVSRRSCAHHVQSEMGRNDAEKHCTSITSALEVGKIPLAALPLTLTAASLQAHARDPRCMRLVARWQSNVLASHREEHGSG